MTATSHALTGVLIATIVKQPLLAIPLAFLSHFVCDAIPHFGIGLKYGTRAMYWWLAIDGLVLAALGLLLISIHVQNPVLVVICASAAMSPDLAWFYYGVRRISENGMGVITKFHQWIQWYEKVPGIAVDITWSVVMLVGIIRLQ